jgi:hypothetical protein
LLTICSEKVLLALLRDQERMRERMEKEVEALAHKLEVEREERLGKSSNFTLGKKLNFQQAAS